MNTLKFAYIAIGIVSIIIALSGLFRRKIHGLGAYGTGDMVFYPESPIEFWFTVASLFIFGIVLIYIALIKGD